MSRASDEPMPPGAVSASRRAPSLRAASGDRPSVRGFDLCRDLIGRHGFVAVMHLDIMGVLPDDASARMLDAALVTLIEHGLTPSAIAARMTALGAPDQLQVAVASGLLGAGDRYLGSIEQVALLLRDGRALADDPTAAATAIVDRELAERRRVPGFGHPIHRGTDERAAVLAELQRRLGLPTAHLDLAEAIAVALSARGRPLPMNAAAAIGAAVVDMGLPPAFGRALALIARSAGLVAHVFEEAYDPIGPGLWAAARDLPEPQDLGTTGADVGSGG